ncbi:MAG TPA: hypothetical protein ENN84_01500 [Candidatus Marinimicrobia bacterium]|nr:hypothetical protein [Candidatus Neomarinimicrobiota bacterium]
MALKPGKMIYLLDHQLINSDSLLAPDSLRWTVDTTRGRFILLSPIDTELVVKFFYSTPDFYVPQQISTTWIHRYQPEIGKISEIKSNPSHSELYATGTLFRSIQVNSLGGNQIGAGVDLRLSGQLSPDYRLTGAISDQSIPTQAYSSTQSLEEIDRIYLLLQNEKLNGEMGDIRVRSDWSHWLRMRRELMGLTARYKSETWQGEAILGGAKGRWRRQIIQTQNGVQGPYRLQGENGESAIMIVARSEQVWYNGRLLESHEYTLYLQEAELMLEPPILPKAEDRLIIEFSYRNELYSRSTAGVLISQNILKGIQWRLAFSQEADNAESPLDMTLSHLSRDSLQTFSRSGLNYLITAYRDTNGAYILEDGIYRYIGHHKGEYSVVFYREQQNGGYVRDYDSQGQPFYRYAPEESGSVYFPRRYIMPPVSNQMLAGAISWQWKNGAEFTADAALNNYASNLWINNKEFSKALIWRGKIPLIRAYSPVSLSYEGWIQDVDFQAYERILSPDYQQDFALQPTDTLTQQQTLAILYEKERNRHQLTLSEFSIGKDLNRRQKMHLFGHHGEKIRWQYEAYRLFQVQWLPYYHWKSSLNFPLNKSWRAAIQGGRTFFKPWQSGIWPQSKEEGRLSLAFRQDLAIQYILEKNDIWQDSLFLPANQNHDWLINWQSRQGKWLNSQLSIRLRNSKSKAGDEQFAAINQNSRFRFQKIEFSGQWQSSVQSMAEAQMIPVFIYVGQGLGHYRWDEAAQDYITDILGDHILRRENSAELQSIQMHSEQWHWRWQKNHLFNTPINLNWQHQGKGEFRGEELTLWRILKRDRVEQSITFGQTRFRNEFQLRPQENSYRLSFITENERMQNLQDQWQAQVNGKDLWQIKYRRFREKSAWEIAILYSKKARLRLNFPSQAVDSKNWKTELFYDISLGTALRLSTTLSLTRSELQYVENFTLNSYEIKENLNWQPRTQERLTLEGTISQVKTTFQQPLPWDIAEGKQLGRNYQFLSRYERSLSENLSMNLMIQYRQFAKQASLTLMRMELRAYF